MVDGGSVETTYNERHQPAEARVLDDEGTPLFRIVYTYSADGRLSEERLIVENLALPKEIRDLIPREHRAVVLAQMKAEFEEISQHHGISSGSERSYVYDAPGNMIERHMRQGPIHEDITWKYNERGDAIELTRTAGGVPHPTGEISEPPLQCRSEYEYDSYGNWISKTESWQAAETETAHIYRRQLTYYD